LGRWIAFVLGGVLGVVAGAGGMLIAFPFLFPPPVVSEAPPGAGATTVSRIGTFRFDEQAPGRDLVHWANGTGAIYRADRTVVIRLDENFRAGPGPNYWVYLNTVPVGEESAFRADAGRVKLAPLKSFTAVSDGDDLVRDFFSLHRLCATAAVVRHRTSARFILRHEGRLIAVVG
jgi:hypothetical protein